MSILNIEIAYATVEKQMIIPLTVDESISVLDAIKLSGIAKYFVDDLLGEIDTSTPIGIFGRKINVETYKLRDKDRIEIYRPLNKTPNQKRIERSKIK